MVKEDLLLNGTPMYKDQIAKIGADYLLDQVCNHMICEQKVMMENHYIIVTETLFIFTSFFAKRLDDIELFEVDGEGSTLSYVTVADRMGLYFKRFANLMREDELKIKNAVAKAAPNIIIGFDPVKQLEYKKRHIHETVNRTRAFTNARLSRGAALDLSGITRQDLIDEIRNNLIYIPQGLFSDPQLFITEEYFIYVKGRLVVRREDIEWIYLSALGRYGGSALNLYLNNGQHSSIQIRNKLENRKQEELAMGILLPNAYVGRGKSCAQYWASRHP